jgi:hypothetical protein
MRHFYEIETCVSIFVGTHLDRVLGVDVKYERGAVLPRFGSSFFRCD